MAAQGRGSPARGTRARTILERHPRRAPWSRAIAGRVLGLAGNGPCRARQKPPPSFASPKWAIHAVIRAARRIYYSNRMSESRELGAARACMAAAEAVWASADGLARL